MTAIIYLGAVFILGDLIARRFYHFVSLPHRVASAFLTGIIVSTWVTYLCAMGFSKSSNPMRWANVLFFIAAAGVIIFWKHDLPTAADLRTTFKDLKPGDKWDWALTGVFLVFACWMMIGPFDHQSTSSAAIVQGFAAGHELPAESPLWTGGLVRPYFLFLFQAGNLGYLGLDPAWATYLLSVLTLAAVLICTMFFGKLLLRSSIDSRDAVTMNLPKSTGDWALKEYLHQHRRSIVSIAATLLLYGVYVIGIGSNPPGFYVDESGLSYNAYLISKTGAGEFGPRFPLFFQLYTGGFAQYSNPTQIYLLAIVFWLLGPSILAARLLAAASVFAACMLLGSLAAKVSGRRVIGAIVALSALLTPWLFEVGRLALETFFYPMAVVLFLWAVHKAQQKEEWTWNNAVAIALSLTLLTYSYTIGRLFAPLLALGLIFFAANTKRLLSIIKTWAIYGLTLVPLFVYVRQNPELTTRFRLLSYIKPESSWIEIISQFVSRYIEDINPVRLLSVGDINPRHHIPDALGSFFVAVFVLAVIGIIVVLARHRRSPWWWFVLYGLAASAVPGALTVDPFHTLRMIAYPMFLLLLTVPALGWLLEKDSGEVKEGSAEQTDPTEAKKPLDDSLFSLQNRRAMLGILLVFAAVEASYFHWKYYQEGPKRGYIFDAAYKPLYDAAVAQPDRPIYLVDGYWGPAYMHSFWYAALEGRGTAEFIHLPYGERPPAGAIVISSEDKCSKCEVIAKNGTYLLYREFQPASPDANVFREGKGSQPGQFEFPHGTAADDAGNIFVADTGNGRIQKFSPDGVYLATFGKGICKSPKAVAVDGNNILVADSVTNQILKFKADDFSLLEQWTEPNEGLYGPSDIAIDADKNVYVVDQGRARVVKFTPNGEVLAIWGRLGSGDGEFKELTGISVDKDRIYIADAGNARIQVLDTNGKFLESFQVAEWSQKQSGWQSPDVLYDERTRRIYASSSLTHEIFIFETDGKRIGKLEPGPTDKLSGPTSLTFGKNRQLYALNTLSSNVSVIDVKER